jgi:hypothetical protein
MNATTIIKEASTEGVTLALSATGTIKATGDAEAVARWIPAIREYKGEIIEALKAAVTEAQCWRVRVTDSETCIATSGTTRADIMTMYPDAISMETYQPPASTPPTAAMTGEEESALRAWLAHIGETNPEAIAEVVLKCQHDTDARRYFIGRAMSDCSSDKVFSTQRSK